jgi:dimethylglycine dehydrogenase
MAALQSYTIDLLSEVERESGQDIGFHMTGGMSIASTPERWEWLQSAYRIFQTIGIDDCRLMGPDEIKSKCPIMETSDVLGGLWADREGYVDTTGTVHAYAGAAKKYGADVIEHTKVEALNQRPDGTWDVVTDKGNIHAEHVVNAGGLWAKQLGRMAGLDLPLSPLSHHYFITDSIPEIAALNFEVPMSVDLEGFTYMRQDQQGILIGIYENNHQHWQMDGAPWDYGFELLQEDPDRIEAELMMAYQRYPVLENVGIKNWVNGAFTFSPDGNPLVGPVQGVPNYWLACGVMAGFLQGGGVGKTLAEWMIHGEAEADAWPMDIARYGKFASNRNYIKQTTGQFYSRRFVMSYPNEQLPAGRKLKCAPAHTAMDQAGAIWGQNWGLEVPLMFATKNFQEKPTLKRSNAFDGVAKEVKAVREHVGLLDISGFSRFSVTGPNAKVWLDQIMSSRLPTEGRARLAVMLAPSGRLQGDLTLFNWGDGTWWIMGSYYLRAWHMRWFQSHMNDGVEIRDISDATVGFALSGPKSRHVLQALTHQDVSNQAMPFLGCQTLDIGLIRARVGRLSVCGELGYEINCSAVEHIALRDILLEAGAEFGLREFGFYAMNSLRLEKSFGVWSAEFRQEYTPFETGMDRWIDWEKPAFIGREAAMKSRDGSPSAKQLVTLELDADQADASGYEPVWQDDKRVGYITSGGYGHHVKKSLAMALIDRSAAAQGTALSVHVVGKLRHAHVIAASPYDPEGRAMRT